MKDSTHRFTRQVENYSLFKQIIKLNWQSFQSSMEFVFYLRFLPIFT